MVERQALSHRLCPPFPSSRRCLWARGSHFAGTHQSPRSPRSTAASTLRRGLPSCRHTWTSSNLPLLPLTRRSSHRVSARGGLPVAYHHSPRGPLATRLSSSSFPPRVSATAGSTTWSLLHRLSSLRPWAMTRSTTFSSKLASSCLGVLMSCRGRRKASVYAPTLLSPSPSPRLFVRR